MTDSLLQLDTETFKALYVLTIASNLHQEAAVFTPDMWLIDLEAIFCATNIWDRQNS